MNKTIHYCWFGGNPKSKLIEKCIASWKKYFPDFEIKEWNENNFDVRQNKYVSQAYDAKKYAFVSDFARFKILHEYGGLYFDTDVEVIKPFYGLLEDEAFAGFETDEYVAPGLVLWVKEPQNNILGKMLERYSELEFINPDGTQNTTTICVYFTGMLRKYGLKKDDGSVQTCGDFKIYPKEYFCPFNDLTGELKKTDNSYTVHWYSKTWLSKSIVIRTKFTRVIHRYLGVDFLRRFRR